MNMKTDAKDALTNLADLLIAEVRRQLKESNTAVTQPKTGENVLGPNGEIVTLSLSNLVRQKLTQSK
jgi:hypothetical protein